MFAVGNLTWMVLVPSWSSLPFHFIWMSLLLLYGLGYRTSTRPLTWGLLVPVMTATGLLFADERIRGLQPYAEVLELPVMVVMLYAIMRLTNRRKAAMASLDEISRHNLMLLERQRAFVQNASHELRTPITVALAHAELLPGSGGAEAAEDAAIVADELGRLRRLVDRLLLLATAEQPSMHRPYPARLAPVVEDVLRRWQSAQRTWLAGQCDDVTVFADIDRLVGALDAILDNAVRYTREDDAIEVSLRRHGQEVAITVADSGPGIPQGQLSSVFNRFERGACQVPGQEARGESRARNFGLGLSIVRAVAETHGGRVTASRSLLGGAAVTVWLPLHDRDCPPSAADGTDPAAALWPAR